MGGIFRAQDFGPYFNMSILCIDYRELTVGLRCLIVLLFRQFTFTVRSLSILLGVQLILLAASIQY